MYHVIVDYIRAHRRADRLQCQVDRLNKTVEDMIGRQLALRDSLESCRKERRSMYEDLRRNTSEKQQTDERFRNIAEIANGLTTGV